MTGTGLVLCRSCGHLAAAAVECPERRHRLRANRNYSPTFEPLHHGPELGGEHLAAIELGGMGALVDMLVAEGRWAGAGR